MFSFQSIKKLIIVLEISIYFLIQKHVFIQFLNNQKLLIQFNQTDVIVGKSLVKHIEERRKTLKRRQREGSIIDIELIQYTFVNLNMQGTRHFVRISACSKKSRVLIMRQNFFFFLKALFYTLLSLRISNWKIISHKIKQLHHFLKKMRIFSWS